MFCFLANVFQKMAIMGTTNFAEMGDKKMKKTRTNEINTKICQFCSDLVFCGCILI